MQNTLVQILSRNLEKQVSRLVWLYTVQCAVELLISII